MDDDNLMRDYELYDADGYRLMTQLDAVANAEINDTDDGGDAIIVD